MAQRDAFSLVFSRLSFNRFPHKKTGSPAGFYERASPWQIESQLQSAADAPKIFGLSSMAPAQFRRGWGRRDDPRPSGSPGASSLIWRARAGWSTGSTLRYVSGRPPNRATRSARGFAERPASIAVA